MASGDKGYTSKAEMAIIAIRHDVLTARLPCKGPCNKIDGDEIESFLAKLDDVTFPPWNLHNIGTTQIMRNFWVEARKREQSGGSDMFPCIFVLSRA